MRVQMLDTGFELIKNYGMTHTSVDKVLETVGAGKSTFYKLFPSKGMFVYEIMKHKRSLVLISFEKLLNGRKRMTANEGKGFLKRMFTSDQSIYRYLTPEDDQKLKAALPKEYFKDEGNDEENLTKLLYYMEGVREDIDYLLVANLMKVIGLACVNNSLLHTASYDMTIDALCDTACRYIFLDV